MDKKIMISSGILCVLLAIMIIVIQFGSDRKAPEIRFGEKITYKAGDSNETLLQGVKAIDEKDGDVSDTLLIEGIYPDHKIKKATIIYVAKDHSNNITKIRKTVGYSAGKEEEEDVVYQPSEKKDALKESGDEKEDSVTDAEGTTEEEPLPEGSPRIVLAHENITVSTGETINYVAHVAEVTDDKDSEEVLWKRIRIHKDAVDTSTPGKYKVYYMLADTDGNESNHAVMTVTVK